MTSSAALPPPTPPLSRYIPFLPLSSSLGLCHIAPRRLRRNLALPCTCGDSMSRWCEEELRPWDERAAAADKMDARKNGEDRLEKAEAGCVMVLGYSDLFTPLAHYADRHAGTRAPRSTPAAPATPPSHPPRIDAPHLT